MPAGAAFAALVPAPAFGFVPAFLEAGATVADLVAAEDVLPVADAFETVDFEATEEPAFATAFAEDAVFTLEAGFSGAAVFVFDVFRVEEDVAAFEDALDFAVVLEVVLVVEGALVERLVFADFVVLGGLAASGKAAALPLDRDRAGFVSSGAGSVLAAFVLPRRVVASVPADFVPTRLLITVPFSPHIGGLVFSVSGMPAKAALALVPTVPLLLITCPDATRSSSPPAVCYGRNLTITQIRDIGVQELGRHCLKDAQSGPRRDRFRASARLPKGPAKAVRPGFVS